MFYLVFNPIPTGQHFDIVQPDSYRSTFDIQLIPTGQHFDIQLIHDIYNI